MSRCTVTISIMVWLPFLRSWERIFEPHPGGQIVCQNAFHILNALLNDCLIIWTTILTQQELQHIDRNILLLLLFSLSGSLRTIRLSKLLRSFRRSSSRVSSAAISIISIRNSCPPLYQNPNPKSSAKAMSMMTGCLHCSRPLSSS